MSSPIIVMNNNETEKKRRGRPRKILPKIANATPSIEQQFRIFKNITEPNMLLNSEIQQKDFIEQIKDMEFENMSIQDKIDTSFLSKMNVNTFDYADPLVIQKLYNDKQKAKDDKLKEKNLRKQIASENKKQKDDLKKVQRDLNKPKEQEVQTKNKRPRKETFDGQPVRYEDKNIAVEKLKVKSTSSASALSGATTVPSKRPDKMSQGTDRQPLTKKTGDVNFQGTKKSQMKTARASRFKPAP